MKKHAAMVQEEAHLLDQAGDGSSLLTSPLHSFAVRPVPIAIAKVIIERHHYLHSLPGDTQLAFGVFENHKLTGALTIGVGPANVHRLVAGADRKDCGTLTRLWLTDDLPRNSETRVLGIVLRALRANTDLKFMVSYADPCGRARWHDLPSFELALHRPE